MLKFNKIYFTIAVTLFIIEVLIALYLHDAIIRPSGGDFLVVILVYCFGKSFVKSEPLPTLIGVLLFAYTIEIGQYFHLVNLLGLQDNQLARVVIGVGFSWSDMLMYTLGAALVWSIEWRLFVRNALKRETY